MKKIASLLLVFILAFSLASCSSAKKEELENEYYETVQEYIRNGETEKAIDLLEDAIEEIPDSRLLNGLLETLKATYVKEETTKTPTVVNETTIINDFKELRKLYFKWFEDYTFAADKSNSITLEDYSYQYPVNEIGIHNYEEFKALFTRYCDDTLFLTYESRSLIRFKDVNGFLYAVEPEILQTTDTSDKDYKVTKVSETEYKLVYNEFHSNFGDIYYYKVTLDYILGANGEWKFCNEKRENMGYVDGTGNDGPTNNNKNPSSVENIIGGIIDNAVNGIGGILNNIF